MPEKPFPLLFEAFQKSDKESWKQQLSYDLPEVAYSDLVWRPTAELDLEPLYTRQEWLQASHENPILSQHFFPKTCENRAVLKILDLDDRNPGIREKIRSGADGVILDLDGRSKIPNYVIDEIDLELTSITLLNLENPESTLDSLIQEVPDRGSIKVGLYYLSAIGHADYHRQVEILANLLNRYSDLTEFRPFGILGYDLANLSSNPSQELAVIMACLMVHLDELKSHDCPYSKSLAGMEVDVVIGDSFFLEIGKLRALRFLIQSMGKLLDLDPPKASAFRIHASIASPVESEESPLIKTTTRAISSILGGADSISISCHSGSDPVDRAAFEIPSILKHESNLMGLADPCYGAYYVDKISWAIARSAWENFLTIEKSGGIEEFLNEQPKDLQ